MTGVDWVYLEHDDLGPIRVSDEPGVVERHESRGYRRADEPTPEPFVPAKDVPPAVDGFVPLVHPLLPGVVHDWPDNPEALQGAHDAGWRFPEPAEETPGDRPDPDPDPKSAKKAAAKKAAASADQDKE